MNSPSFLSHSRCRWATGPPLGLHSTGFLRNSGHFLLGKEPPSTPVPLQSILQSAGFHPAQQRRPAYPGQLTGLREVIVCVITDSDRHMFLSPFIGLLHGTRVN